MRSFHELQPREKFFLVLTIVLVVLAGAYYGFLENLIGRYQSVNDRFAAAQKELASQRDLLAASSSTDREYEKIEASLPKPQKGKKPDKVFSEDMEAMFKNLQLPTPNFGTDREIPIPEVVGFSYLMLPILGVRGDLDTLAVLLKKFALRNLVILKLKVSTSGQPLTRYLEMSFEVAQVVQSKPEPGAKAGGSARGRDESAGSDGGEQD